MIKSGFVAVVGKPNVGKSTLVNALVGEKVSITSPKPQTTRNKILGILNTEDAQVVFVDTPGVQNSSSALGTYLRRNSTISNGEADLIVLVVDAGSVNQTDFKLLEKYRNSEVSVFVVVNKIDKIKPDKVFPILSKLNEYTFVKKFFSLSALTKKNVNFLLEDIISELKDGEPFFDREIYTDKSMKFIASEVIREKALLFLQDEVPHGIAVVINLYNEKKTLNHIQADIIVNNPNHKQIVIGENGSMLKKIGTSARNELEKMLDKKVLLELFVVVKKGWIESMSGVSLLDDM